MNKKMLVPFRHLRVRRAFLRHVKVIATSRAVPKIFLTVSDMTYAPYPITSTRRWSSRQTSSPRRRHLIPGEENITGTDKSKVTTVVRSGTAVR